MNPFSGATYPFSGVDHALAMFAIGLWAAQLGGKATWAVPLTFATVMIVAIGAALSGVTIPGPQMGSAVSVVLLGLFILFRLRTQLIGDMFIAGAFALYHGYARGPEMLTTAPWLYTMGYVGASIMLHLLGVYIGQRVKLRWYSAIIVAIAGVVLMVAAAINVAKSTGYNI
jgi:urease accessory protein